MLSPVFKKLFLIITFGIFIWSGVHPSDRFTWFLETFPAILGIPLLIYFDRKNKVSPLLFILVCLHSMILCIGGRYTYALVPAGDWVRDALDLSRNPYDRLGHFFQGFQPALLTREVLLRNKVLKRGFWLSLYCVSVCLAFSAFYELIEWWTAVLVGDSAESFLGTQGDVWDTQWDMFLALLGAMLSLISLSRLHDKQLPASLLK